MSYIAFLKQEGEGCDYSIGCGYDLIELTADNHEKAIEELKKEIIGEFINDEDYIGFEGGFNDERKLAKVTLYEVTVKESIPVDVWYKEAMQAEKQAKNDQKSAREKAEYERLKTKYEK